MKPVLDTRVDPEGPLLCHVLSMSMSGPKVVFTPSRLTSLKKSYVKVSFTFSFPQVFTTNEQHVI